MEALLGGLIAVAVIMTGCRGGEETLSPATSTATAASPAQTIVPPESPTNFAPTTVATVEERAAVQALLKTAALRSEDLPSGFTLDEEKFTTNEQEAEEGSAYLGPTLEELNRFGRILGYEAGYSQQASGGSSLGGTLSLQLMIDVYRESRGAQEHLQFIRRQISDPQYAKLFKEGFASGSALDVLDVAVSPMSLANVEDEQAAFEIKITVHSPDPDRDFDQFILFAVIRSGRGIGGVTMISVGSPSPVPELEKLTRKLDERLESGLQAY